ncbi:hypothetical protein V8J82_18045 [Gymnodinialimonas sp. 2305UL16-5]|uniref:hypothetical protein n=1 Tax=Gymnodinialimonas mytili TaxID=3126503 RepID=UPI0030AC41EE
MSRKSRPYRNLGPEVWDDELEPGEKLLWTGRPARGLRLTQEVAALLGFAIAAHGVGAFILYLTIGENGQIPTAPLVFLGFLSFIFIGISVLFIWFETSMRNCLYYAVTDRRAIILNTHEGPPFRQTSYPITPDLKLSVSLGRRQTLWFKPRVETSVDKSGLVTYADPKQVRAGAHMNVRATAQISFDSTAPKSFRFLEDARAVRDLIEQVADGTYRSAPSTGG